MSTYERLAELRLDVDGYLLEPLEAETRSFKRLTTVVRLLGAGQEGLGEDVTYEADEQRAFREHGMKLPLKGRTTLERFSSQLGELDLFSSEPRHAASRNYRRWAFEAAALDLALRQANLSLASLLAIEPRPVRFVVSMGLGRPPSSDPLLRWRERFPTLGFKLDAGPGWDDELCTVLARIGGVAVVDFKGAYHGTPVDLEPDAALYARVARLLPGAWLEDPALDSATRRVLAPHADRVTWDAPLHSLDDLRQLELEPLAINVKASRFGSLEQLCAVYDFCRERGIEMYGGGQFELGPGRGQIQYLASLFHADTANDVAPTGYNLPVSAANLEPSPLAPRPDAAGFRWSVA